MSQRSISQLFINSQGPRYARIFATFSLSAAIAFASANAVAQQPEHAHSDHSASHGQQMVETNPAAQRKAATETTESFINAHKQWAQARGALNKALSLENLMTKAEARHEMLAELIHTNPAEVLRVAIPEEKQQGIPAEVQALLEMRIEVEGELEAIYEDYQDGSHKLRHFVKTSYGERFELFFANGGAGASNGARVSASGVLVGNHQGEIDGLLALSDAEESLLMLECCDGTSEATNNGPELTDTFGDKRTLVILVNFQDDPNNKPWTVTQVQSAVFDDVNNYFVEASYGQTSISGDVLNWTTIAKDSDDCSSSLTRELALNSAIAQGVDPDGYDRRIYLYPNQAVCGISGTALAPGKDVWINGTLETSVIAHELGHNLGLLHANSLECGDDVASGNCFTYNYGDKVDTMGNKNSAHFNPYQKERLGWLSANEIIEVSASGQHNLKPYELGPDGSAQVLKVLRSVDPVSGEKQWFYMEYRQPVGFDNNLLELDSANLYNGILVRLATESDANSSLLLDMTPNSDDRSFNDWKNPSLEAGYSFTDSESGISISTDVVDSNAATVSITLGSMGCVTASPSISVTPGESAWVEAGSAVTYSITVTNNDSPACGGSNYDLSTSQPAGWSATLSSLSVNLVPGASGTTSLVVTSENSAANGFYEIGIDATDGAVSISDSVTYVVDNQTLNSAPVANNDTAATEENTSVTIMVLNNDNDPDGDSLTITSTSGVNGTALINSNGSLTFVPANGFVGTESFSYSISDGNGGSASASVSVNVTQAVSANSEPVAVNDAVNISSLAPVTIAVTANDWDPEGDAIDLINSTQGNKGEVVINADGTLTYTPGRRFKNSDSFSYSISDGEYTATATVNIVKTNSGDTGGKGGGKGKK